MIFFALKFFAFQTQEVTFYKTKTFKKGTKISCKTHSFKNKINLLIRNIQFNSENEVKDYF